MAPDAHPRAGALPFFSLLRPGARPARAVGVFEVPRSGAGDRDSARQECFQECFQCGKRGHKLPKCTQCSQAYYCNANCQRKHWNKHKPVCRAAVAALARRATRERLARAVRDKGKDEVEHSADDDVCVICQDKTVNAVEVSVLEVYTP